MTDTQAGELPAHIHAEGQNSTISLTLMELATKLAEARPTWT